MFYPKEEFDFQVAELVEQGFTPEDAVMLVTEQMLKDEEEYHQWRDEQDEIARQEEMYAEHDDNWYDEQYEIEADYY